MATTNKYVMVNEHELIYAALGGILPEVMKRIQLGANPATHDNLALRYAANEGHLNVVEYLATLPGVDPAAENNDALIRAAENGHLNVVEFLAMLPGANPAAQENRALKRAVQKGHLDVVKYLVTFPDVYAGINEAKFVRQPEIVTFLDTYQTYVQLIKEVKRTKLAKVERLVNTDVDPTAPYNWALHMAVDRGDLDVVEYIIGIDEVFEDIDLAIEDAETKGKIEIFQFLQQHKLRIRMSEAIETGNLELVRRMIEDGYDPAAFNNEAIGLAAVMGELDIVQYLASLPEVDPADDGNQALRSAMMYGYNEVVEFLLTLPSVLDNLEHAIGRMDAERYNLKERLDAHRRDQIANIDDVINTGNLELLQQMIEDGYDPSTDDNYVFWRAVSSEQLDMVKYLASLPEVDPTAGNVLRIAALQNNIDILEFLLTLPGMAIWIDPAIDAAKNTGRGQALNFLLDYKQRLTGPTILQTHTVPFTMEAMPDLF